MEVDKGWLRGNPCVRQLIVLFGVDNTVCSSHHCRIYVTEIDYAMSSQPPQLAIKI